VLPLAVARFSSGDFAVCYVLLALWITTRFHVLDPKASSLQCRALADIPVKWYWLCSIADDGGCQNKFFAQGLPGEVCDAPLSCLWL